ncbi:MAG TPA: nucleotidyltransferase family protein [Rhodanobacteraceae bacterium]
MRALIFAAGRGERMRPLTDTMPKPLLDVAGKPLIVHHLEHLAAVGVHYVVINTSHLAGQFPATLGDGSRWGLRIRYAYEGDEPLETGGGMLHAMPLLGDEPFLAINGDVYTDFDFAVLPTEPAALAHLVLADNPAHHPQGDFHLAADGHASDTTQAERLTFAGIGIYRPRLLDDWRDIIGNAPGADAEPPRFKLAPILRAAMAHGQVTGEHFRGRWSDVGTPERLVALNQSSD